MTRKMKDSGIEWIGEIPEEWKVLPLKKVSFYQEGPGIMASDFRTEGTPLIRISGMKGNTLSLDGCNYLDSTMVEEKWKHFKLDKDDIVVSASASTGIVATVENDTVGAIPYTGLIRFKPNNNLLKKYLVYFISSDAYIEQINVQKTGSTIQHYGPTHLAKVKLTLPSKQQQEKIIEVLDKKCSKIDEIIEKENQVIEKLKEYKLSVITEVVTKGLNPDVPMKDSGIEWIGKIPEHWTTGKIKSICTVKDGTHDTPQYVDQTDESLPLITSKSIKNGDIDFSEAKYISREDYLAINQRSDVQQNDVIMPMIGTIGNPTIVNTCREFSIKNVALFKCSHSLTLAKLIKYFMESGMITGQFDFLNRGGVQSFVSLGILKNLVCTIIPQQEQKYIVSYLDTKCLKIDCTIVQKEKLIQKLTDYKKSLIYECVTGKREV